jgi:diguanylate cyclase (GGDEF)-like protein
MKSELPVLIADDEPSMRSMLSQLLQEEGYRVIEAENGDEALEKFKQYPSPLVITDIRMPGLNGVELLQEIKRIKPGTLVIIITSHASIDSVLTALRAGAYDYLTKPFEDISQIMSVVGRATEQIDLTTKNVYLIDKLKKSNQELEKLNKILKELSIRDGLTGLYNHRRFQEALALETERGRRYQRTFSLIFFDVDYFKKYNDSYGHLEGDRLLQTLAQLINHRMRKNDLLARYGGEEFVVLLPETPTPQALHLAENIRNIIAEYPFPGRESMPGGKVTVSIGVANFPDDGTDSVSLVNIADRKQYQAKHLGRNRVC